MFTSANSRTRRCAAAVGLACALAGSCAVGPNFVRPAPPGLNRYAAPSAPVQFRVDGVVQTVEPGRPVDAAWWRLFGSPTLDGLVAAGLKASPTLASARAALRQSQAQARAGAGVFFPSVSGTFDAAREHSTPRLLGETGPGSTFSLYTLAGDVSYALDLFGGERRSVEALNAQAEYQDHAVGAAYLLLTGGIVNTAIARAGYVEESAVLTDLVALDSAERDILQAQYRSGYGALSAVLTAQQQLAADQESLAGADQRQAAAATLLAALTGREPAEEAPPYPELGDLAVPADAPVSLPAQLVRQRPDILKAEALLHAASAEVGVATAALFPSITLTGDYGAASASLARLSSPAGRFWSIGPTIDAPIFRGGALWFGRKAAQATLVKAQADYRQTVLAALEQVADQLKALDADARVAAANSVAFDAAALNHSLADVNLKAGVIAGYDALSLAIQADRARLGLMAAKSQRLQDVVGLYLASGGGWTGHSSQDGLAAVASR